MFAVDFAFMLPLFCFSLAFTLFLFRVGVASFVCCASFASFASFFLFLVKVFPLILSFSTSSCTLQKINCDLFAIIVTNRFIFCGNYDLDDSNSYRPFFIGEDN